MHRSAPGAARAALFAFLLHALPLGAIQPIADQAGVRATSTLPAQAFVDERLNVGVSLDVQAADQARLLGRTTSFEQRHGGSWEYRWDSRGNRPNVVQGSGIALVPGLGNSLRPEQLGLRDNAELDLATVAIRARGFLDSVPELMRADRLELQLDTERSVAVGVARSLWLLEFAQFHRGVPVDGAYAYLRISQGNIVQFGAERLGDVVIGTQPSLTRELAFAQAWSELGFPAGTRVANMLNPGELRIYPRLTGGERSAMAFAGLPGTGYDHVLAWRYQFRLENDATTWQILVDAQTNRVIEARDINVNVNATVSGGIYPTTNTDAEIVVAFPYTAVSNGSAKVTDALGIYDYSGGTATATLNGKYFQMSDTCGAISLANSTDGNLNFGASAGTDCITPGVGGAGNTHASRSGFYHLTKINQKARAILPANAWLQGKVVANMNVNQTCNAGWDGTTLNFYRSGAGCSNTGELAAVFLHEWGHGMDTNSGGAASEYGSGEAVGDTFAFLETRDSCIGQNFQPGVNCANCTLCTGVRDVGDFSSGAAVIAKPSNVTSDTGINCDRFTCPYLQQGVFPYQGPMGYEGHCESYIASSANWDLTQALVTRFGSSGIGNGWAQMDKIWYASLTPSKSAYRVSSGGTCNASASVDGCGANNWYTVYLAADDDDGNLANGTPNACRIWDAMNAHGIACGTRPVCSGDAPDFSLAVSNSPQAICAGSDASFTVNVGSQLAFANVVTLSGSGQPGASTLTFAPNPATPGTNSTLTLSNTAGLPSGSSTLTINGAATASPGHSATAQVNIFANVPSVASLSTPANAAINVDTAATFTWAAVSGAQSYTIEVASDASFTTIVASQAGLTTTSWAATGLARSTQYFWRVRATNSCGNGGNSAVFSFTTANIVCNSTPLSIPDNIAAGADSPLNFTDATVISGLKLKIKTTHTWVGDLKFTLKRGATNVIAIDRPGVPASTSGCNKPNIDVTLDDASGTLVESLCSATSPAIGGVAKPNNPLDAPFSGQSFGANWTLNVSDNANQDIGSLVQWCLEPKIPAATTFTVGGTVTGLAGSGLALSLNGGGNLPIAADGNFSFPTNLANTAPYVVTVATQPSLPTQTCVLSNDSGSIAGANVNNVAVVCTTNSYAVGGNVNGLLGTGLTLALNGGASLPISADGGFTFPTTVASGTNYAVTVTGQPNGPVQTCSVSNGSGPIVNAPVTTVSVECIERIFADDFEL